MWHADQFILGFKCMLTNFVVAIYIILYYCDGLLSPCMVILKI